MGLRHSSDFIHGWQIAHCVVAAAFVRYRKFAGVQCLVWAVAAVLWLGVALLDVRFDETAPMVIGWWVCVAFEIVMLFGLGKSRRAAMPSSLCRMYEYQRPVCIPTTDSFLKIDLLHAVPLNVPLYQERIGLFVILSLGKTNATSHWL